MQRHFKINKRKIIAITAIIIFVIAQFTIFGSAIQPPMPDYDDSTNVYQGQGNITENDVDALYNTINAMHKLGYFQLGEFVLIGRTGSTMRLYCIVNVGQFTYDNNTFTISGTSATSYYYADITSTGFYFLSSGPLSSPLTFQTANVAIYVDTNNNVIKNENYSFGTATSQAVISNGAAWQTYFDKVYNYDTKIQNAINAGFAQGQLAGYQNGLTVGREEGYETGYEEGYYDGEADGYSQGAAVGYGNGLIDGREEGYETGYQDGYDDGYETGYSEGINNAGGAGDIIINENLDIGSIISALPEGAKAIIDGAFGFTIFGINVAGTLTAILVIAIVAFVVKWLLSLKS